MDADIEELERLEALADSLDVTDSEEESEGDEVVEVEQLDPLAMETDSSTPPQPEPSKQTLEVEETVSVVTTNKPGDASAVKTIGLSELFLSVNKVQNFSQNAFSEEEDDDSNSDDEEAGAGGFEDTEQQDVEPFILERVTPVEGTTFDTADAERTEDPDYSEQESEEESDEDDLAPTEENLESCNKTYEDNLKIVMKKLTKELDTNLARQAVVDSLLEEKECMLATKQKVALNQHVSVSKKTLTVFGFPYFKDQQIYHAPPNPDTTRKKENKELDPWIEYPRQWNVKEAKILHNAVRREAIKKRIGVNDEKREELESKLKQIGLRDEDREQLEEEYEDVRRTIRRVKKLPDAELFDNRWEEFDWMKIAVKDFALAHSASDCCLYWKNFAHPSINKTSWTEEEDLMLKKFADATNGREWDVISSEIGTGRTAMNCMSRYMTKYNIVTNNRSWAKKEDEKLRRLVALSRVNNYIPWTKVSYYMDRRTKEQCYQRYSYSLRENMRRGPWDKVEEWILIVAQRIYNKNWPKIAEQIPTRTPVQTQSHWNKYMKSGYKAWEPEDDIILMESIKKHGVKDWVAVSKEFNDPTRDRYRCRLRFQAIYKHFKRCPDKSLDNLGELNVFKRAAKRRQETFSSLEAKLEDWLPKKDTAPVISNIPIPSVDLNATTVLPNGASFRNRVLSKFLRHCQSILPPVEHVPLAPLPPIQFRSLPDEQPPPHLQPVDFAKKKRKQQETPQRKGRRKKTAPAKRVQSKSAATKLPAKSAMDREMSKLFRPSYMMKSSSATQQDPEDLGLLNLAVKNLDGVLDFSAMKSNLDPTKFAQFSPCEEQLLDHYWFQTDISVAEVPAEPSVPYNLGTNGYSSSMEPPAPSSDSPLRNYGRRKCPRQEKARLTQAPGVNVIMPSKPTLVAFRGALLHSDYTAELASKAEPKLPSFFRKNTHRAAQRELQLGITSSQFRKRRGVGQTLFTPAHQATDEELSGSREQVLADRKLVERMAKLFYWPAAMSITMPSGELEDLFKDDHGPAGHISASDPLDTSDIMSNAAKQKQPKSSNMGQFVQSSVSMLPPPSVMSVYSDVCTPMTPVTKTYSRKKKRPAMELGVNFQDIIEEKRQKTNYPQGSNHQTSTREKGCLRLAEFSRSQVVDIADSPSPSTSRQALSSVNSNIRVIELGSPQGATPAPSQRVQGPNVSVIHVISKEPNPRRSQT